jgi:serine O-acetyltransferase
MFDTLRRDCERYVSLGGFWRCPGFWIVALYRFGFWAHAVPSIFLRIPLLFVYRALSFPFRVLFNVKLSSSARVGAGFCLIHPNNILIADGVEIGRDCLIFHEVTLGSGHVPGVPKIGDRVDIYVGARILGGVAVGDRSMIGANCVIIKDVPPDSVALPVPTRVIPRALMKTADPS